MKHVISTVERTAIEKRRRKTIRVRGARPHERKIPREWDRRLIKAKAIETFFQRYSSMLNRYGINAQDRAAMQRLQAWMDEVIDDSIKKPARRVG